ncbi:hypothetical protein MYSTI_05375 [Myxococcus stipitatus DSM 14675]|uniref:Lipoprotein n=1 Tax=Myxococcus stipitatus (strain DSM 14675 / JCM 12634 / Mx s8) TaxID=1278073 RepID=L7UJN2_MYXSD|nr:hypothetical protein [Myxococcus stipitatus]AGC46654.1 hypothetical protein MYSTI_05375 [Myxococcus stipitatus DSM 14675]
MRHLVPVFLCLALAACGGDFSNDDLEFLNALPQRQDLAATVPGQDKEAGGSPRIAGKTALAVGRLGFPSGIIVDTDETGRRFNEVVDSMLASLETIRSAPPTEREPDRRVWGPYPDRRERRFEARFVMTREGERFDYQLQYRRGGEGEDAWWSFITGSFQANGGIRKGSGSLILELRRAREKGFILGLDLLEREEIHYQTRTLPTRVELVFVSMQPLLLPSKYIYRQGEGGVAEMTFELQGTDFVAGGLPEDVALTTRWSPDGRGSGSLRILKGDIQGAQYTECWDNRGRVTFISRSWDFLNPTEGVRSSCPDMTALDR